MSSDHPDKQSVLESWFEGDHVLIHLDARRDGVDVPKHLRGNHSLTLKVSHLFQGPTSWNDVHLMALLKFNGEYYRCVLPWSAVWGMTSSQNEQRIWPEDLPTEVVRDLTLTKLREIGSRLLGLKKEKEKVEETTVLEESSVEDSSPRPSGDGSRKRQPTLRRIK